MTSREAVVEYSYMELDDLEERISKVKGEIKKVIKKINDFDLDNDSVEELAQYEKLLSCLKEKVLDLMDEVDIELLLQSVNQSLIDEGYIKTYEKE